MWYAVRTQIGKEEKLIQWIETLEPNQDIYSDFFILHYEKFHKVNGKMMKKKNPLFPGYLFFVSEKPKELQMLLKRIPEYGKVLGYDEGPVPITSQEEEFLKSLVNKENTVETSEGYIVGDELMILSGPLVGKQGLIKRIDRHKRLATLEVEFLGQMVITQIGLEIVSKVNE